MPIDMAPPSPAVQGYQIQPVQTPDPLQTLAQMGQLRAQNLQAQQAQLGLQQTQMEVDSENAFKQAYLDAQGDPEKAIQLAQQSGKVLPKDIFTVQKLLNDAAQAKANLDKTRSEADDMRRDKLHALYQPLFDEQDPSKQALMAADLRQQAISQGLALPNTTFNYTDPDSARMYEASLNTEKWMTARAAVMRQQNAATTAATGQKRLELETPKLTAEGQQAERANAAANLGAAAQQGAAAYTRAYDALDPDTQKRFPAPELYDPAATPAAVRQIGMTAEQQTQAAQAAATEAETKRYHGVEAAQRAQQLGIEGGRLNIEKQRFGFESGGGVSPQAQAIAAGQIDPSTARLMIRSNPGLIAQIKSVDPNFDQANMDARYETLKEYTNTSIGKAGGQLNSLNTLIHHADLYQQTADALKNGTFRPGNAVYNEVAKEFGSAPPTNAALVAQFFAGETGKVATGGVPGEGEVNNILKNLGSSNSPEQIRNAGRTLLQIAMGRADPLIQKARQAKIDNVTGVTLLTPDAKAILQKNGFDPETLKPAGQSGAANLIKVRDPNGKAHYFRNQADADRFRKLAGIK